MPLPDGGAFIVFVDANCGDGGSFEPPTLGGCEEPPLPITLGGGFDVVLSTEGGGREADDWPVGVGGGFVVPNGDEIGCRLPTE